MDRLNKSVIRKTTFAEEGTDLAYWLTRTPEERVLALEFLRQQYHGTSIRLERVYRVVKREKS